MIKPNIDILQTISAGGISLGTATATGSYSAGVLSGFITVAAFVVARAGLAECHRQHKVKTFGQSFIPKS